MSCEARHRRSTPTALCSTALGWRVLAPTQGKEAGSMSLNSEGVPYWLRTALSNFQARSACIRFARTKEFTNAFRDRYRTPSEFKRRVFGSDSQGSREYAATLGFAMQLLRSCTAASCFARHRLL